jgi:hypothetical protein
MVKCGVLFEVRTEFLNNIQTSFVFKALNLNSFNQFIYVMVKRGVLFEVRIGFSGHYSYFPNALLFISLTPLTLVITSCAVRHLVADVIKAY